MFTLRAMGLDDYAAVLALISHIPDISLGDASFPEATARYLQLNVLYRDFP